MLGKINKTKKSFIAVVGMSLVLLIGSALGFLINTNIGQLTPPVNADKWDSYAVRPQGAGDSQADPLLITSVEELAWLIYNLDISDNSIWYIDLQCDIDLAGHEWVPITSNHTYRVYMNGNNHTIKNMKIQEEENGVGFFRGYKDGVAGMYTYIDNLNFSNVDIISLTTGHYVGAVIGVNFGLLNNVNVLSGRIVTKKWSVGGITGVCDGDMINCSNRADVYCNNDTVGGLAGELRGNITNCSNFGDVKGRFGVGGLAGQNNTKESNIVNCKAHCDLYGVSSVAGLCGFIDTSAVIEKSYFQGEIEVTASEAIEVHPFVANIRGNVCRINNCYSVAEINLREINTIEKLSVDRKSVV